MQERSEQPHGAPAPPPRSPPRSARPLLWLCQARTVCSHQSRAFRAASHSFLASGCAVALPEATNPSAPGLRHCSAAADQPATRHQNAPSKSFRVQPGAQRSCSPSSLAMAAPRPALDRRRAATCTPWRPCSAALLSCARPPAPSPPAASPQPLPRRRRSPAPRSPLQAAPLPPGFWDLVALAKWAATPGGARALGLVDSVR